MAVTVVAQGAPDFLPRSSPQAEDTLLFSNLSMPNVQTFTQNVTMDARYVGIIVVITGPVSGNISVATLNTGALGIQQSRQYFSQPTNQVHTFHFPQVNFVGDVITVTAFTGSSWNGSSILIFGARSMPGIQVRPDGRMYPQNDFTAFYNTIAIGTLITAPAAPVRVLLSSLIIQGGAANSGGFMQASIQGASMIYGAISGIQVSSMSWPAGLLCDPGTAVSAEVAAAGAISFSATYDLIT